MDLSKSSGQIAKAITLKKGEQEKVQTKTFTKWINTYLCQLKPPKLVKDLMKDLSDGLLLLDLLEILTKTKLKKEKPKNMQRIHSLTNVKTALEFLNNVKNIKLVNINASDVVDGKPSIVLGLIWTAILHFQIEEQEEFLLQALGMENDPNAKGKGNAKKGLMAWTNNALSDKYGLNIKDFGESWCDGKAFNALVHNIDPSLINMDDIENKTNKERLENAFNVAESELGIPKLLDVEDVDVEKPDEKSIMTYVAQFLKSYPEGKRSEQDLLEPEINSKQMSMISPPSEIELIQEFNENVDKNFENPNFKNDFDVFSDLMDRKDNISKTLMSISNENNPDIDKVALRQVNEDFKKSDMKLNEWQWNLDKSLPGILGSEIAVWLQDAEESLMEPFPDCTDKMFDDNVLKKFNEHESIFNKKNDVLAKFRKIQENPPSNISKKQLQNIENRIENVIQNEKEAREKLNIFVLQAILKEKAKKWKKELQIWNSPINSEQDIRDRIEQFNISMENGTSMDKFTSQLDELIKRKSKFCKENPPFEKALLDHINQDIIEREEENDELPNTLETCRKNLETLSSVWDEVNDNEEKIEVFLNKLRKSLRSEDLEQRKSLTDQLPEFFQILNDMKDKIRNITPQCSPKLLISLNEKLDSLEENLTTLGETVIDQMEKQEQEMIRQQEAAQQTKVNEIVSNSQLEFDEINDWLNNVQKCLETPLKGSSEDLKTTLENLENLEEIFPKIEELLENGYRNVKDLENQNASDKAKEIKNILDEYQKKFDNSKNKEIPKNLANLRSMIDILKPVENNINDLEQLISEGKSISDYLEKSNPDNSVDIVDKEKKFLDKENEIINSLAKDKDFLKKLNDLSKNSILNINLKPLEEKIRDAEITLQDSLKNAKENLIATDKCKQACNDATLFLGDLNNKIQKSPKANNDEEGQKTNLKNIENLEENLKEAESLIKAAEAQRNAAQSNIAQSELKKIDENISKIKNQAAEMKENLNKSKANLADNLTDWNDFKKSKESIVKNINDVVNDLDKSHKKHKGIHGNKVDDKAKLLEENKERLEVLENQEKEINDLIKKAAKLGSEKPTAEVQNLKKQLLKEKEELEKEIKQNEMDLENHQQFDNDLDLFHDWLLETEQLANKIEQLPNTKEGLIEKQKLLDDLNKLKSQGDKKLKDLKNLQKTVLNETAPDEKETIIAQINNEQEKFNEIFGNLDQQDGINETIEKLENIGENSESINENIEEINKKLEKCLNLPNSSLNEKEKISKELNNSNRLLDQQLNEIEHLKAECGSLENCEAVEDLFEKLKSLENKCNQMKEDMEDKLLANETDMKNQEALEEKLDDFDKLMKDIDGEMSSIPEEKTKAAIDESLEKIKNLKSLHSSGRDLLEKILKSKNVCKIPEQCMEKCEQYEVNFFSSEDEIKALENHLIEQKNNWINFDAVKENIEKTIDSIGKEIKNSHDLHKGIHGKDCTDKAKVLQANKNRLASLNDEEKALDNLIKIAKSLESKKPENEALNLKKKFLKEKDDLEKEIKVNEKDLENHKKFDHDLDSFHDWLLESEKLSNLIDALPNTKNGLIEKQNLLEKLNKLKSEGDKKLKDLKNLQKTVLNETAPDEKETLIAQINNEQEKFNEIFGNLDQQDEINETIEKLENVGEKSENINENIEEINKKLEKCLNLPNNSLNEKEKISKELNNSNRLLDQQLNEIEHLKAECGSLENCEAVKDVLNKLENLEDKCMETKKQIEEKLKENDNDIKLQKEFEEKLNEFSDLMNETEIEFHNSKPEECTAAAIEMGIKKLNELKSQYSPGKNILDNIKKLQNDFNAPQQCVESCYQSEQQYYDLEDNIKNLEKELETKKNDWASFNAIKSDFERNQNLTNSEIENEHKKRNGIHGGDLADKEILFDENKKRLENLNSKDKHINELLELARRLGSNKAESEVENLRRKFIKQKEDLKKEILQNEKDFKDHEKFNENLQKFKDWMKEREKLAKLINNLPHDKAGLLEKQTRLGELMKLKSEGNEMIKNLKNLQNLVLNETSPEFKNEINSSIQKEIEKFQNIFGNLDDDQDNIKETIENLTIIENKFDDIRNNMNEIENSINKYSVMPTENIADKEKLGKAYLNLEKNLNQQILDINELKQQCKSLDKTTANMEMISNLNKISDECNAMKVDLNEMSKKNAADLKNQQLFDEKLNEFNETLSRIETELNKCSPVGCNDSVISDNLKKLKKIKSHHEKCKIVLTDLLKYRDLLNDSKEISEASDNAEQKYSDVEDEITKMESKLEMQKNDWSNFNSEKNDLEKWLEEVNKQIEKIEDKTDGIHAGKLADKEQLLDSHRKILQDVINHEADIKMFIDRSTPLLSTSNQESPKRITNTLCKKYEKLLEALTNKIQHNEEDLNKHENYKKQLDNFVNENNLIIKDLNDELDNLPNTKNGLKRKADLFGNLKEIYTQRKQQMVNLENIKNDVIDHSSPKYYSELEQQWDQIVDNFERNFNPSVENQSKLLVAVQQIEKTESACKDLSQHLQTIDKRQHEIMSHPISSLDDIDYRLQSLKDLRYELRELQTPISDLNRKQNQNFGDLESVQEIIEEITDQYKSLNQSISGNLNEAENQHKQLCNIKTNLNNFKNWLDYSTNQIDDRSKLSNFELNNLKKNLNSLKTLRNEISEHKVDLTRLQNILDQFMKISSDNSLQKLLDEITEEYSSLNNKCQNETDKCDHLIKIMNKYESSRSSVLHWIETNTQILLKCSDYSLKQSQMKSKLMMIENLEKDLENYGQSKFIEAIQDGEELINELSGPSKQLVVQQINDLKSDWMEISRQLNQLSSNLKNTTSRSEAFKEMSNQLSLWLDDMEHTGLLDSSSIEHECEIPFDSINSANKCDRIKTLLIEINRRKQDFSQLSNLAAELGNPSFDIENSQIQNRYNRLSSSLKDKIEKLSKQQDDYEKIKQNIEEMEKWVFQTSIRIINENTEQGNSANNNDNNMQEIESLIQHSNEIIQIILSKEPELSKLQQTVESILSNNENSHSENNDKLANDLSKLIENFNNLKSTVIHKRDHLNDSVKKWDHYQSFLQSTRAFLDNDLSRWWKDKRLEPVKSNYSTYDNENIYKDIVDMENKLNGLKNLMETEAKECDGMLPTITTAVSRSQTPSFKSIHSMSSNSPKIFSDKQPEKLLNGNLDCNVLSREIYDELEDNLKKLSEMKKDHQEKTADWNSFNREKTSFKNWLDNEKVKLSSTLCSTPGITNLESFQKNKLKVIQDEMNYKKPTLSNLNNRYADLTSQIPGASDSDLKNINREFDDIDKKINRLLNREDKEVEANFTDDESNIDIMQETKIPKLNLSSLENSNIFDQFDHATQFSQTVSSIDKSGGTKPKKFNFSSQTPVTKTTQTNFKEINNYGTQTKEKSQRNKEKKAECVLKILDSLKDINSGFENSKNRPEINHRMNMPMSAKPRSSNLESVRRNMTPANSYLYLPTHSQRHENGSKYERSSSTRSQITNPDKQVNHGSFPNLSSIDDYIPTKNKWLEFDNQPNNNSIKFSPLDFPNREFQIDFNSKIDNFPELSRKRSPKRNSSRSKNSKSSRIKDSINKINQDAKDLHNLSERLKLFK